MKKNKIKSSLSKIKLSRKVIYFSLALVCLAAFFVINYKNRITQKIVAERNLLQQLDDTAIAFKKLQQKKNDFQAQGVDTSAVETKINQIYDDLFKNRDYQTANNQIKELNDQLDNLLAEHNGNKLAAEQLKGDLSGTITCNGTNCKMGVGIKLLSGSSTTASSQTDQSGNYSFHQDAGSYDLSASLSGYKAVYKSSVNILSSKKIKINLDLKKIYVPETSNNSSIDSSASSSSASSTSSSTATTNSSDFGPVAQELNLINDYRASNGLSRLSLDSSISTAASGHSAWMNSTGNFSHYGENGSAPWDRCTAAGTSCSGEILFMGSTDPTTAFNSWKNSPPHNAIMLGNNFSAIGIGIVGVYWSADFR